MAKDQSAGKTVRIALVGERVKDDTGFCGHLKRISLSRLDADARDLFDFAFPAFFAPERRRRWSPGSWLARNRYASICDPDTGDDNSTMKCELDAYRDMVRTGYVRVVDAACVSGVPKNHAYEYLSESGTFSRQSIPFSKDHRLLVLIYDRNKLEAHLGQERLAAWSSMYGTHELFPSCCFENRSIYITAQQPDGSAPFCCLSVPWNLDVVSTRGVFDLRQPWARASMMQMLGTAPESFYSLLPWFVTPQLGGIALTSRLGIEILIKGYNALIYPSARTDVSVDLSPGTIPTGNCPITSFSGWNFVDIATYDTGDIHLDMSDPYLQNPSPDAREQERQLVEYLNTRIEITGYRGGSFDIYGLRRFNQNGQAFEAMLGWSRWHKNRGPETRGEAATATILRHITLETELEHRRDHSW